MTSPTDIPPDSDPAAADPAAATGPAAPVAAPQQDEAPVTPAAPSVQADAAARVKAAASGLAADAAKALAAGLASAKKWRLPRVRSDAARPDGAGVGTTAKTPAPKGGRLDAGAFARDLLSAFGSLAIAGAIGALYAAFVIVAPRPPESADLWAERRAPSVIILDRNGEELVARGSRYGEAVSVEELPPYMVRAFLATEDRRFYEHGGVDLRGTLRAFLANLREGGVVEGGSTITQQLARNLFLSPEQTYIRKAREALLALWLEGRYTKDQILSLYLNRIYLGAGAYGVEQAAKTYFGKSAREVTLSEAVMLAGLPKAPGRLAPTLNPYGAQTRANVVLDNLVETGAITEFEAREARKTPPVIQSGDDDADFGYLFDHVAELAREIVGDGVGALGASNGGDLVITTTLDARMQRAAQQAVSTVLTDEARLAGAEQAALIAYDANGALRAMVGGRSYVESQFNRATQALRQPGSAFKPFVFVAALEAGVTPQTAFVDQPVEVDGWRPANYTPGHQGRMRLSEAAAKSVNTIAVQASEYAGRENVVAAAKRLGIRSDIRPLPSIALGAVNVTLEELTGAYIAFARGGMKPETRLVERIENRNYEVIYQYREKKPEQVITPEVAENVTHLLFQVINSGTGGAASLGGRLAAGKTGTTDEWRDAWFVGYTAQMVAGVWVGNDANTPMNKVTGGTLPAQIWKQFMLAAHQDLPRRNLPGAYPAANFADEAELIGFYSEVQRGLRDVRRDGNARRGRRDWD